MTEITMEKIVSWAKRRGFVFPSSEIYGGFSSSYDYGPLGAELIANIKNLWWQKMVHEREDIEGIDGAIITHPKVWEASGHVENFTDPLVDCRSCKKRFRADKILEEKFGIDKVAGKSLAEIGEMLQNEEVPCPHCGLVDWTEVRRFNLLLETNIGVTEEDRKTVYLRGETCQTIYLNWENVLNTSRQKIPFGIAQIGKAFRNEITPGNFIFRTREFEQMEMQFFVAPETADGWYEYWKNERMNYLVDEVGLSRDKLHLRQHAKNEMAHYAKDAYDLEYNTPWGWWEFEGIHHRGDWDLSRHSLYSGKKLEYFDQEKNLKYTPWVIETSGGVGRLALIAMLDAYCEEEVGDEKKKEIRVVMKFSKKIAPIKIAILPLMKKDELVGMAKRVFDQLKKKYVCQFDVTQSIGKRYRRQDEIGTPYCLTVDFDSLDDQSVTIRDRDTMEQKRISIKDLDSFFQENL